MKSVQILAASLAAVIASPAPQGVTQSISPPSGPPSGCSPSFPGQFQITVVKPQGVTKRDLEKRDACAGDGTLVLTLVGGLLLDAKNRTGYIASNYQFQFDGPPQAGAIYTAGYSVCSNNSLALGGSTVFYECQSGGFYNLYNTNWAPQCSPVAINAVGCGSGAAAAAAPGAGALGDGQATASSAVTAATDGQPQASSALPVVTQKTDGQPQATSAIAVVQRTDGQPNVPTPLVSQLMDGQPQATSAPVQVVSQISDGQPQAGNATITTKPIQIQTAAAAALPTMVAEFAAVVAGAAAVVLL